MHGCDSISCLSVTAKRISEELNVVATRIGEELSVTAKGIERLKVTCSIICSVNNDAYLRVVPDVVWLSPDELASAEFDIYSNVVWKID